MNTHGADGSGPGLEGMWERIPSVTAVTSITIQRTTALTVLRDGWLPRHTAALALLTPVVFASYWSAGVAGGLSSALLTGAMSLTGGLLLVTYLPTPGTRVPVSSCALMPLLIVPFAGLLISQAASPFIAFAALGLLVLGLWQRVAGLSVCNERRSTS